MDDQSRKKEKKKQKKKNFNLQSFITGGYLPLPLGNNV